MRYSFNFDIFVLNKTQQVFLHMKMNNIKIVCTFHIYLWDVTCQSTLLFPKYHITIVHVASVPKLLLWTYFLICPLSVPGNDKIYAFIWWQSLVFIIVDLTLFLEYISLFYPCIRVFWSHVTKLILNGYSSHFIFFFFKISQVCLSMYILLNLSCHTCCIIMLILNIFLAMGDVMYRHHWRIKWKV